VALTRPDGRLATLSRPGWPDRPVALHRRSTAELIAEELRHLDPDGVYCDTIVLASKKAAGASGAASKKAGGRARAQAETSAAKATAAATGSGGTRPGRSRTRAR
jgi:glucose-6-phosphate dehydrogenase assembly protein OpcA